MLTPFIRRRILTVFMFFLITLVIYRGNFRQFETEDFPQMNDRRILETHGWIAIPSPQHHADAFVVNGPLRHPKNLQNLDSSNFEAKVHQTNPVESVTVVLVMAAKRAAAVVNHLNQLIKYRPSATQFPIIVSQDGASVDVTFAINKFVSEEAGISFIHHRDRQGVGSSAEKMAKNYFFIAQHYKWALDKIFFEMKYDTAIITEGPSSMRSFISSEEMNIIELNIKTFRWRTLALVEYIDDLDIAEDFFSYFSVTRSLLRNDPTIWCISAWNDNGGNNITEKERSDKLYRTDFFPGLGWMLTEELWRELSPKWPEAYWDDWLRRQDVRKDRVCIRPEVSRTSHNNHLAGKGSSGDKHQFQLVCRFSDSSDREFDKSTGAGAYHQSFLIFIHFKENNCTDSGLYRKYLASIHLPEASVDFALLDLSYLFKENYDKNLLEALRGALTIRLDNLVNVLSSVRAQKTNRRTYRIFFHTPREYRSLARMVGLMTDIRSGMTRTAYYGVVTFFYGNSRFYAISGVSSILEGFSARPSSSFYDEKWDQMSKYLDFQETYCKRGKFVGKCDPLNPELIEWFRRRKMFKRLQAWGQMIVN